MRTFKYPLSLLLITALLIPNITLALEGAAGGEADGSEYGGGTDGGPSASEGSGSDYSGRGGQDSPSESGPGPGAGGADAEATNQAAADAQTAAGYGMNGEVDVNATAQGRMDGTIDSDQVAMKDGTVSSLSQGKAAAEAISAAAAIGGADTVNTTATHDAYQSGAASDGDVVGNLTGAIGPAEDVVRTEIAASVTKSAINSLSFDNSRFGGTTSGLDLSNMSQQDINSALSAALNNQKSAINKTTMSATDLANVFSNIGANVVNNTKTVANALGYAVTEVVGVKNANATTKTTNEVTITAKNLTVENTPVNQSKVAELDKFGRDIAAQINATYSDTSLTKSQIDDKVDGLYQAYDDKKTALFGGDAKGYQTVSVEGSITGTKTGKDTSDMSNTDSNDTRGTNDSKDVAQSKNPTTAANDDSLPSYADALKDLQTTTNTNYSFNNKTKDYTGTKDGKTYDSKTVENSSKVNDVATNAKPGSTVSIDTKNKTISVFDTKSGDKSSFDSDTGNTIQPEGRSDPLPGSSKQFVKDDLGRYKSIKTSQSTPSTDLATGKTKIGEAPDDLKNTAKSKGFKLDNEKTTAALAFAYEIDPRTRNNIVSAYKNDPSFKTLSDTDIKEAAGVLNAIAGEASRNNRSVAEQIAHPNYLSSVTVDEKAFTVMSDDKTREALTALADKLTDGTIANERGLNVAAPAVKANHFYASYAADDITWSDDLSETIEVGRFNKTTIGFIKSEINPAEESVSNTTARSPSLLSDTPIENVNGFKVSTVTPTSNLLNSKLDPTNNKAPATVDTDTTDLVVQKQIDEPGTIRDKAITSKLEKQLAYASKVTGLKFVVTSGGQASKDDVAKGLAELSDRTGSTRHDHGNAADGHLVDSTGHTLDMTNPEDQAKMKAFMQAAVRAGATGVGAGIGYMGKYTMHIGGGDPSAWGAKGKAENVPSWVKEAWENGMEEAKTFDKTELDNLGNISQDHADDHNGDDSGDQTQPGDDNNQGRDEQSNDSPVNASYVPGTDSIHGKTKEAIKSTLNTAGIEVSDQTAGLLADATISTALASVLPMPLALLLSLISKRVSFDELTSDLNNIASNKNNTDQNKDSKQDTNQPDGSTGDDNEKCQPTPENPCVENQGAMLGVILYNPAVSEGMEILLDKLLSIVSNDPVITLEDVPLFPEYAEVTIVVNAKDKEITLARYDLVNAIIANSNNFPGDELDGMLELFDEPAILFGDNGSIIYSNGLYSPVTTDGVVVNASDKTKYTYVIEYIDENGNSVKIDNNNDSLPEGILTNLTRGIFADTAAFTIVDVETIVYDLVDPRSDVTGDEYYDYFITLRDGSDRAIVVPQYTSVANMQERFSSVGYFGDVLGLISIAKNQPRDERNKGLISKLADRISEFLASFGGTTDSDTPSEQTGITTELPTHYSTISVEAIESVFVYPNAEVSCPQIDTYTDGYVYVATIKDPRESDKVTTITNARCGNGEADVLISEIANNLATDYNITGTSYDTIKDKTYFRVEPIMYTVGVETLDLIAGATQSPVEVTGEEPITTPATSTPEQKPNLTNDITLEVKAVGSDGKILSDWSPATKVTISSDVQLYLRWDGSAYQQCLPFLHDGGTYALTRQDRAMLKGNTESEGFNLTERTAAYKIECGGQRNDEFGVDERVVEVVVE